MSGIGKSSKMINHLNHRIRVTLSDTRQITGQLLAFDKYMNLVLSEAEEFRVPKKAAAAAAIKSNGAAQNGDAAAATTKKEEKRTLGLIILRGEWIISMSVEGPPPADPRDRLGKAAAGPGSGKAVGRGIAAGGSVLGQIPGMAAGLGGPVSRQGGPGSFAPPTGVGRGYAGR